jgi:hypothetical protein
MIRGFDRRRAPLHNLANFQPIGEGRRQEDVIESRMWRICRKGETLF